MVKLPFPHLVDDDRAQAGLAREARVLAELAHPSIQRLLHASDGDVPHIVLEYVEGPTLGTMVETDSAFHPVDVVLLGMQIGAALHYVHGRGLVHHDIKPGNVVLRDGRAVLIDFDIARPVGWSDPRGKPRGSAPYMAPEQCRAEPASISMDLWGLGALLFEVATGERPFRSEGRDDRPVYPQLEGRAPRPAGLPPPLTDVISSLLEPDPAARPPSAAQALARLEEALPSGEEGLWPDWVSALAGRPG